jgi:hypothetical protein
VLLILVLGMMVPAAVTAQTVGPLQPSRSARARLGADGGSVALAHVRLVIPPAASGGEGFAALGVGGVPAPPGFTEPVGETGIVVSVSPLPRDVLLLEIRPTAIDLAAAGGDLDRLALLDTAGRARFGCQSRSALLLCPIPGAGLYLITVVSQPLPPLHDPTQLQTVAASQTHRIVVALMVGLGVTGVLLVVFTLCSESMRFYVHWWGGRGRKQ